MVVLDESKENFILDVPSVEDVEDAKLREEERKRTGRYLAVTVVVFVVGLGLYHTISNVASQMSALISAAMIMVLYLLWLWYAARRRKHKQKKDELIVEKQVSSILQNLNNIKTVQTATAGSHDNYVYSSSEDEVEKRPVNNEVKLKNKNFPRILQKQKSADYCNVSYERDRSDMDDSSRKSSRSSDVFIRTYSIA